MKTYEISQALKSMKNNKTPGIDGIPADFLKVFWYYLKYFIQRSLNCCFRKGKLSYSLCQSIIICIPKDTKDRRFLKNWRPISLLCVTYKLASTVIANRMKPYFYCEKYTYHFLTIAICWCHPTHWPTLRNVLRNLKRPVSECELACPPSGHVTTLVNNLHYFCWPS